jgi:hypothetical protein
MTIKQERLDELRAVISKLPGVERKSWRLEVYQLVNGLDQLTEVYDIKTGKPLKPRKKSENVTEKTNA